LGGDEPVSADYDGDRKTDVAVFRKGVWWRLNSGTNTVDAVYFGLEGDIPVPARFDNDNKADVAVYRSSTGTWYWLGSDNGNSAAVQFGLDRDIPLPADYDGDGKADITVFRPANSYWYRIDSSTSSVHSMPFGLMGDMPLQGDFDGDSKTDIAVWRPATTTWYIMRSSDSGFQYSLFGLANDIPVPADYDGDGKADVAVFRTIDGVWHRLNSSTGSYVAHQFGFGSDITIPGARLTFRYFCHVVHCYSTPSPTPTATLTSTPTAIPSNTQTPSPTTTSTPTATSTATPTLTPTAASTPTGNNILLVPSIRFQTMRGWEVTGEAGQFYSPAWNNYKNALLDQAVNDLGLNRVRLEIKSGIENPVDYFTQWQAGQISESQYNAKRYEIINDNSNATSVNASGFQWASFDGTINQVVPSGSTSITWILARRRLSIRTAQPSMRSLFWQPTSTCKARSDLCLIHGRSYWNLTLRVQAGQLCK
jgi:hypothetical protein